MNSSHWCISLWGLLPEWVLCWAGKWWWVNWSTPGLYSTPPHATTYKHTHTPTHKYTHIHTHTMFSHISLLPGPLHYLPAHSCQTVSNLFVFTFFVALFPLSLFLYDPVCLFLFSACVLSVMLCPPLTKHTPPNTTWHTVRTTWQWVYTDSDQVWTLYWEEVLHQIWQCPFFQNTNTFMLYDHWHLL